MGLGVYQSLFDVFLLNCGFAFSQFIVLRAGVFSIASAAYAGIGGYATAILVTRYGVSAPVAVAAATALGLIVAGVLSIPLARLRGVYQAIATLAFVEIVVSLGFYAEDLTGGAMGINGIPKLVGTGTLCVALGAVLYLMVAIDRSGLGRAFDTVRQDETVAGSLGISVQRSHAIAFIISGGIGGLFGGLQSLYVYSIEPQQFGFALLVSMLASIVLGGRGTVIGPIIGTAILTALPELARPLAENRPLIHGLLLIVIINYLPHGVADSLALLRRRRRAANAV